MPNKTVKISVEGGNAKAAPPLAPTLSQLGLNVGEVVKKINEVTAQYKGLTVQVIIEIDSEKKTFEVKVGQPSTTSLLVKAVNAEAPSGDPEHKKIGNLGIEKIIEIAKMKKDSLTAKTLKKAVKSILGTAKSIGITVDNKDPKVVIREIDEGKYDEIFNKYQNEW